MKIFRLVYLYIKRWCFMNRHARADYWWSRRYIQLQCDWLTSEIEGLKDEIFRK